MQLRTSLTLLVLTSPLSAQLEPFAAPVPVSLASGEFHNPTDGVLLVSTEIVGDPGAASLRVFFDEVDVPAGGYIEVTGLLDGEVHRLTQEELEKWEYSSAFFNGDKLQVDLYAGPKARASYDVSHVLSGFVSGAAESICFGVDDRIPSNDNRATRLMNSFGTSACSGWLGGPDDCVFGAGHCFTSFSASAQFNVPLSTSGGALQHPPIADQFPVDQGSRIWNNGGLGDDWGVCRLLTNNLGESASAKYGWYELGFFLPDAGQTTRITGFGSDNGNANQTNQTHTGPYTGTSGFSMRYQVDTTGGNSGSVVIFEDLDVAVGIHTNAGCGSTGGANSGTSLLNPDLMDAWEEVCSQGVQEIPVAAFQVSTTDAKIGQNVFFENETTGFPDTWSWDLDGDGLEDSSAKAPVFTYDTPGTYTVSMTASNSLGSDSLTLVDAVTVTDVTPVAPPYVQDFAGGLPLGPEWVLSSTNTFGEITSSSFESGSPGSGHPALAMAAESGGNVSTNEATLHVDLSGVGSATLSYWIRSAGDENDFGDGVTLSDGTISTTIADHGGLSEEWTQITVELFDAAAQGGLDLGADTTITFRQTDNFELGQDGILIDDVALSTSLSITSPVGLVVATFFDVSNPLTLQGGPDSAGDVYFVLGSATGTTPGVPIGPFEIPLFPDAYFTHTLTAPNQPPLAESLGSLDGSGQAVVDFELPSGLLTTLITLQHAFVTFDSATLALKGVSNATQFTIIP